ncbi:MAG TPA: ATP-binding protein [bacterium]|nr:ATP-binding protein [bacterium]HPP03109.1 ATP-binding protein [bacterium]
MSENPLIPTVPDDEAVQRQRLIWLAGLRRYAAVGMAAAAVAGRYVLGIHIPVAILLLLAAGVELYNWYFAWRLEKRPYNPRIAFHQIILDVIFLSLALFFTGGFLNPFFTVYFFVVITAWITLSRWQSLVITLMVLCAFGLQGLSPRVIPIDMRLSGEGLLHMGELPFHVVGAPFSFVLTTLLTAYSVSVIMRDLRRQELEVRAARQQAELELNKLDNILRHVEAGMLVLDGHNRVEWANDRVSAWFGSEGMDETRACYRVSQAARRLQARAGGKGSGSETAHYFETRLPTLAQGVRDFEIVVNPISDARGEQVRMVVLILDVTEQKKNQEQWAQAQKLAAIGQLAAGIAHEINTPLGTINILAHEAQDILRGAKDLRDCPCRAELEEFLATIHGQTRRCKDIIQNLLNFSRKPVPARALCNLNEPVRQAAELIHAKTSRVTLVAELDESLPLTVTDAQGIERVVFNLLLNAADALEEVHDNPRIHVRTAHSNGVLTIQVSDNGAGIHPDDLPHIFEPFYTTKTVGKGTGLGLYVSYGTIRDLGGTLEIASEPGRGTTATICLPVNHEFNHGNDFAG